MPYALPEAVQLLTWAWQTALLLVCKKEPLLRLHVQAEDIQSIFCQCLCLSTQQTELLS